jgi:hypothetical protein
MLMACVMDFLGGVDEEIVAVFWIDCMGKWGVGFDVGSA